jgi:subtilase family serine protease
MISDGVSIISNSWAYCEDQTTLADVQSIDTLFQTAAASGISVFNGAGDSGSTCLDGASNTIGVPADSPNATSVGGSSASDNPAGFTYSSESWWDGAASIPSTGQGGFGTSKFFSRPSYQGALGTAPNRSIPDVVVNADPAKGYLLCEADAVGCPNGLLYGGTSVWRYECMAVRAWPRRCGRPSRRC